MREDVYAGFEIVDDRELFFTHEELYYITFGPHEGKLVDINGDVLTFNEHSDNMQVVLAPDLEAFLEQYPEFRDEENDDA